jgi:hypothetical protein
MIDTAKPTRGPWNVFERRPAGYLCGYNVGGDGDVPVAACNFGDTANKANADFIADAGTVYHETNLTPRQLLERVRELEGLLQVGLVNAEEVVANMEDQEQRTGGIGFNTRAEEEWIEEVKTALAKCGEGNQ